MDSLQVRTVESLPKAVAPPPDAIDPRSSEANPVLASVSAA
jgi:hypothetical protein